MNNTHQQWRRGIHWGIDLSDDKGHKIYNVARDRLGTVQRLVLPKQIRMGHLTRSEVFINVQNRTMDDIYIDKCCKSLSIINKHTITCRTQMWGNDVERRSKRGSMIDNGINHNDWIQITKNFYNPFQQDEDTLRLYKNRRNPREFQ